MSPLYRLFSTLNSFAPTLLRLALAIVFFVHGGQKTFGWFGGPGWTQTLHDWTAPNGPDLPLLLAAVGTLTELLGSVGLLLGLCTRLVALGLFVFLAAAIYTVHLPHGFLAENKGFEYPLTLALTALSLVFSGGGRLSLDRAFAAQLMP